MNIKFKIDWQEYTLNDASVNDIEVLYRLIDSKFNSVKDINFEHDDETILSKKYVDGIVGQASQDALMKYNWYLAEKAKLEEANREIEKLRNEAKNGI